jgi:hypothetical protein
MFKQRDLILLGLIFATFYAVEARAQTDNRLALGISVTTIAASSATASGSATVGFEWRLGHEKQAWGWQTSLFNWFDTDVEQQTNVLRPAALGQLRIRPVMVGYGYTWIRGRAAITTDLVGGFAFNSLHVDPADYQRLGASGVSAEATNTVAVKPEVQIWYDINRRLGLRITGGYLITRPSVTIKSSLGSDTWSVKADSLLITAGVVFSII